MKILQQTITRMIREADSAKKRQDNILATSLGAQETMQKELTLLWSSNVKLHIELTDMKAVLRDVQSALAMQVLKQFSIPYVYLNLNF